MLFAALEYNNYLFAYQETEKIWEAYKNLTTAIITLLPDSSLCKILNSEDAVIRTQLSEYQLRWEKEFEGHGEEKRYSLVKQTVGQLIQQYIQQINKNTHISHEKKQEIFQLNKQFFAK